MAITTAADGKKSLTDLLEASPMKVYISATYRDLRAHRLAVSTMLRRMGHVAIGMEDYVAEGMRPLRRCLADVAACEVYIGILAWRYGYRPPTSEQLDVVLPPGTALGATSITEFEFRAAVVAGKHVLMFLLDPEADWPSSQFDALLPDGDRGDAIAKLRQDVSQQYLVSFFRTPEELAGMVSAAVYRYEMSNQMRLESLRIEAGFNKPFIAANGAIQDTSLFEIKNVVANSQGFQALKIDIGQGLDWWMTRLYFLSSLVADLTTTEVVVFVASDSYIGITYPRVVKERLEQMYPLFGSYAEAVLSSPRAADLPTDIDQRAALWQVHIATESIQPVFVTRRELERWLHPYLVTVAVDTDPETNDAIQMQRLLDWPMPFVPIVVSGRFSRVIDKHALTEQLARLFVREQVSRALSMIR